MNELFVLRAGHARRTGISWTASSTVTVIRTGERTVLVDPGCSKGLTKDLINASLAPEDVDVVFITHGHPDHYLNIGLFREATVVDGTYVYQGENQAPHGGTMPGTDIEVLPTPGHTPDHASLKVICTDACYIVAGDLFWWEDRSLPPNDARSLLALPDDLALDRRALLRSRHRALKEADIVIPGHGRAVHLMRGPQ